MTRPFSSGPRGERGIRERIGGNGKAGEAEARAAFARAAGRSDRGGNVAGLVADKRA